MLMFLRVAAVGFSIQAIGVLVFGAEPGKLKPIDDDLLGALDVVGAFARLFPDLALACDLIVAPLTGQEKADCEATGGFSAVGGPPDCTFDAGFGYPCSLEQRQRYTPLRNTDIIPNK